MMLSISGKPYSGTVFDPIWKYGFPKFKLKIVCLQFIKILLLYLTVIYLSALISEILENGLFFNKIIKYYKKATCLQ